MPPVKGVGAVFPLSTLYRPLTAAPLRRDSAYGEREPCRALRPYIRCFWGTGAPCPHEVQPAGAAAGTGLVIPDSCMDIIFQVDYQAQKVRRVFYALDDRAYEVPAGTYATGTALFAVRFYAWAAVMFSEDSLENTKNRQFDAGVHFPRLSKALESVLHRAETMEERAAAAEKVLMKHLNPARENAAVMNALYYILSHCGRGGIAAAASYACVSPKQLQRLFGTHMGMAPKPLADILRYQMLWRDIALDASFQILDGVEKYGYYDQAHLLNTFKKYHTLTPAQARRFARG